MLLFVYELESHVYVINSFIDSDIDCIVWIVGYDYLNVKFTISALFNIRYSVTRSFTVIFVLW